MKINPEIISRAIKVNGNYRQLIQLREECIELALAIGKLLERDGTMQDLQKEVADVNIMIAQANMMLHEDQIQAFVDMKLERLSKRLDEAENKSLV